MKATSFRKVLLPACILCRALAPDTAAAQCLTDDWRIYAATGDVGEIETRGTVAWVGAVGGVIRIDLTKIAAGNPDQFRIDDSRGLVSADVTCLTMDGFGNVYVGTRRSGVSVFDSEGRFLADLSSFDRYLWSDNVVTMDAADDTTAQWVALDSGTSGDTVRTVTGDRVVVSSADSFSPSGTFEGGGLKSVFVARTAGGFEFFPEPGLGVNLQAQLTRELLVEPGVIWIGTSNLGIWKRDETVSPPSLAQSLTTGPGGLVSSTVRHIVRGPHPSGGSVLWIGTGGGLQAWDGVNPPTVVDSLAGQNILDVTIVGNTLWTLAETPGLSRDLYRIDLGSPSLTPERQGRSTCATDTLYVPREVAVDATGRVVVGTREDSFTVMENGTWYCAPPLGPHSPTISDLVLGVDGVLYFGTGDKNKKARPNGLGWFTGSEWRSVTPVTNPEMMHINTTEVIAWPDSTIWLGSTVDASSGGLNHLFPATGSMERYAPNAAQGRVTQGRNIWGLALDGDSNLWVAYGQAGGGLSAIEYPSLLVTNFDFNTMFGTTTLLRSLAADSRGRIWVTTSSNASQPGQLYIVDPRGTISFRDDDVNSQFNVANEIADIAPIPFIAIDSSDRVWLAGEQGLVVGQIGADVGGRPGVTWNRIFPSGAQLGGRNPLPYTTGALDWDDNLWIGTESAGLVRISNDLSTWTWFDQIAGCPLPDQSVTGVFVDRVARSVYVGTATGGIARIDLSGVGSDQSGGFRARAYPNPWRPSEEALLTLSGIPPDEVTTLRFYTVSGELVYEAEDVRGSKTWDGRNTGNQIVEAGVYLLTAVSTNGKVYEGKVAILR